MIFTRTRLPGTPSMTRTTIVLAIALSLSTAQLQAASASPYVGVGVGYLLDSEEAMITIRAGMELPSRSPIDLPNRFSHNLEVEVGHVDLGDSSADYDVTTAFFNYRGEMTGLGWVPYFGAGLGFANADVSVGFLSDDDTVFAAQAFAGMKYNFTPAAAVTLGARYIWMDDVKIFGFTGDSVDDVALEVNFSFRF